MVVQKSILVIVLVSLVVGDKDVPIVSMESDIEPDGKFHFSYETGDGTKAEAVGDIKPIDKEEAIESIQGMSFKFFSSLRTY